MKTLYWILAAFVAIAAGYYLISPAFIVEELDEASPLAQMDEQTKAAFETEVEKMRDVIMEQDEQMPQTAGILAQGDFMASAHEVQGKALLIEDADKRVLRFESFETINGPDLRIYLSADLNANDYVEVSEIRATKGNVNYEIPAGLDTSKYNKVLVWCKPFGVLFSYAELS